MLKDWQNNITRRKSEKLLWSGLASVTLYGMTSNKKCTMSTRSAEVEVVYF